jgi:FkbM family methyltransferase
MKNKVVGIKILLRGTNLFKFIKSKLDSVKSNIAGIELNVHPLDWSFWASTHEGSWEPDTIRIYQENLGPGVLYCDIGAWVGPTVLLAAGLGADVTCFEPDPNAYERLLHNIRGNKQKNIQPFQIALSSSDGITQIVPITKNLGQSSSSIHIEASGKESAVVLALSWGSACRLLQLPDYDFIKIDIEGGEHELIPSMMSYLAEHRPKVFLSTHLPFIAENKKEDYIEIIQSLWELYPNSEKPDIISMKEGFPSYLFK